MENQSYKKYPMMPFLIILVICTFGFYIYSAWQWRKIIKEENTLPTKGTSYIFKSNNPSVFMKPDTIHILNGVHKNVIFLHKSNKRVDSMPLYKFNLIYRKIQK